MAKPFYTVKCFITALAATCAVSAGAQTDERKELRTDGLYRSNVLTNEEGTQYVFLLRFGVDGRVHLAPVAMPAAAARVCAWFKPEEVRPRWGVAESYRLDGSSLTFVTVSVAATTQFEGTKEGPVLQMHVIVPTRRNTAFDLRFEFEQCP